MDQIEVIDTLDRQLIRYKDFTIYYNNKESALSTLDEVFNDAYYNFESSTASPFIIDGGANIGIATIFFKDLYPQAKIICFEADPNIFVTLKKNVVANKLTDVTLINAALANKKGMIDFYGQVNGADLDARGNSIIEVWGMQRTVSGKISVPAEQLSDYINEPVDLLKLDVEGAEQQILEEIQHKLHFVKQIVAEVHCSKTMDSVNSLTKIIDILTKSNFEHQLVTKNNLDLLPGQVKNWSDKIKPELYSIKAVLKEVYV